MNTLSEEQKKRFNNVLGHRSWLDTEAQYRKRVESFLAEELARERERILEAYRKSGIVIEYLATSGGKLFAKLDSDIPAAVSFIDDIKFRSLISKAAEDARLPCPAFKLRSAARVSS